MKRPFFYRILLVASLLLFANLVFSLSDFFDAYPWMGPYHISDPDSLLFLRYLEQSILQGNYAEVDQYGCFPSIKKNIYPPFHLKSLILFTRLFFSVFPDSQVNTDFIVGWLPPLLGWLILILLTWFSWQQTRKPGLVFLIIACSVPGIVASMTFAFLRIDYHFLNSFFIWSWLICAWSFSRNRSMVKAIFGGLAAVLFISTWHGTPMFFFFATIYGVFLYVKDSPIADDYLEYSAFTMIFSSSLVGLYLIKSGVSTFSYLEFGWFQVVLIMAGGVFLQIVHRFKNRIYLGVWQKTSGLALTVLLGLVTLVLLFPEQIKNASLFIFTKDPVLETISELQPAIDFSSLINQPFKFFRIGAVLGFSFFVLPLIFFWPPAGIFSGSGAIIRDWTLVYLFLSIANVRYVRELAVMPGFLNGIVVYLLIRWLITLSEQEKSFRISRICVTAVPIMIFCFLLSYPTFKVSSTISKNEIEAFNWIISNTPPTSGYENLERPEYGILCFWDEGNRISYYARRPVLVNNALWGYKKMAEIFSATTEAEAFDFCRKYQVRYIYLRNRNIGDSTIHIFNMYKNKNNVADDYFSLTSDYIKPEKFTEKYVDTFHCWISNQAAIKTTGKFEQPTGHFRMVFSSKQEDRFSSPEILIYEIVEGAKIQGMADPGTEVSVSIGCSFDLVKEIYLKKVIVDPSGHFSLNLPYPSAQKKGRVETEEHYKFLLTQNGQTLKGLLKISDSDVLEGKAIDLLSEGILVK
ncbi:MAG: hypothetical protein ACOYXC_09615 [Candidatus Rifleibacteriota bacterium]